MSHPILVKVWSCSSPSNPTFPAKGSDSLSEPWAIASWEANSPFGWYPPFPSHSMRSGGSSSSVGHVISMFWQPKGRTQTLFGVSFFSLLCIWTPPGIWSLHQVSSPAVTSLLCRLGTLLSEEFEQSVKFREQLWAAGVNWTYQICNTFWRRCPCESTAYLISGTCIDPEGEDSPLTGAGSMPGFPSPITSKIPGLLQTAMREESCFSGQGPRSSVVRIIIHPFLHSGSEQPAFIRILRTWHCPGFVLGHRYIPVLSFSVCVIRVGMGSHLEECRLWFGVQT